MIQGRRKIHAHFVSSEIRHRPRLGAVGAAVVTTDSLDPA
jgi:hypothetical protein